MHTVPLERAPVFHEEVAALKGPDPAAISLIAMEIISMLNERKEIGERIRAKYQEAADMGVSKSGLKLAIAHSRLSDEKRKALALGYRQGIGALRVQMDLF